MQVGAQLRIKVERESRTPKTGSARGESEACSRKMSDTCKLMARGDRLCEKDKAACEKRSRKHNVGGTSGNLRQVARATRGDPTQGLAKSGCWIHVTEEETPMRMKRRERSRRERLPRREPIEEVRGVVLEMRQQKCGEKHKISGEEKECRSR